MIPHNQKLNPMLQRTGIEWMASFPANGVFGLLLTSGHISIGHMRDYAIWETMQTIIFLVLQGDIYEIELAIEYTSKELRELEEKEKVKEALDSL